ncbi:PAS domain S-box protein [Noviherbaspirillum aridicola]|uniref:histidine kinase n=1 Tax=Noviherbaspirillum aridicola TaxID=2849687 RepID=A0ABQ4Q017_9BURK|nr:PAS domain S-box protein [Noviherbaspirillum aridicola]GIZ50420.1 hypothetical protein NCCP691_04340 [Noviherbaspirillum aridicola]
MDRPNEVTGQDSQQLTPAFRAAVALAAQGGQPAADVARRFGVSEEQVARWRERLLEGAESVFRDPPAPAEAALPGSRDLALIIAENSTQGLALMDRRGYCIYANRSWLEMTGYALEELRSRPLHELVHHHRPDGSPYPMEECPIDRALPEHFQVRSHEDLFFRKDGSRFPVLCAASPVFERGEAVATVVEVRDISAQKAAEQRTLETTATALQAAEANAKFRTFFDQGSYFACLLTLDGTLIEANRLCLEFCGFTREEVIGRKFWECGWWNLSPELAAMIRAGTGQAAEGVMFRRETGYFVAGGEQRILDLVLAPVTDEAGKVLFIAPTGVDITERKRVEERLRLLDEISESTRAAADAGSVLEATTRLLGRHLAVTRCAYADLEADNDRFTIRNDWTVPGFASSAGVYSLDLFGSRAAADMRGGRTLVVCDVDRELGEDDGGAMFNAIGVKAIVCCPLVKGGRLVAMMAVHQAAPRAWKPDDIALVEEVVERSWAHIERVRATEELRRSELHLNSLFEQTSAGIAEADTSGRLVRVNDRYCRILGRRREELVGMPMQSLTHPDDLPRNMEVFSAMLASGEPFEIEKRYVLPGGGEVWVNVAVSLIRAPGRDMPERVLAVVLDITQRKQAEARLREADRRKDEFLAMLAHELRNPLAPIGAAADLLRLAHGDGARVRQASEIIARQVRHMTALVDDLLDVSRVTRGLVSLELEPLDVARVALDTVEQVRPAIDARRHRLSLDLPSSPAPVHGDRKRIVQVMVNLLNNAARYTPEGGHIRLSIDADDTRIRFAVEDDGIGMAPDLIARAFDLFTQGERSADRSQGGLGIGLALVRSLVELHGGTVEAHSDGPGRGSRFCVSLPRLEKQAERREDERGGPAWQRGRPLHVLLVDDNVDAAEVLALFLQEIGHRVDVEHDPLRALERAGREVPDVCLLDIGLPGMDGHQLARALRANPRTAGATLVALTGYGQAQDRRDSEAAGFDHHLVKPVASETLLRLLSGIAAHRG